MANWGGPLPWELQGDGWTTAQVVDDARRVNDEVACAVSFAVTHAREYGADPSRLVLFGHSGGADEAAQVALGPRSSPFPGCAVPPADWKVTGLWEGDWLLANPEFDVFRTALPRLMKVMTLWPSLANAPEVASVEFAVTDASRDILRRPDASKNAKWLAWRDPTGKMQETLDRLGAFADDSLDVGEEAEVMVRMLNASGIDATLLALTDPASYYEHLAEADFHRMVEHVLSLTRH